jgi:hypothetical protein
MFRSMACGILSRQKHRRFVATGAHAFDLTTGWWIGFDQLPVTSSARVLRCNNRPGSNALAEHLNRSVDMNVPA